MESKGKKICKINTCQSKDPTPGGSAKRNTREIMIHRLRSELHTTQAPPGSRTREQRLEKKTVPNVHPETHLVRGHMQEAQ